MNEVALRKPEDLATAIHGPALVLRLGDEHDAGALLALLRVMHAENGEAPINVDKVTAHIGHVLEQGVVIIAERDDEIVGSIGLMKDSYWYSDATRLGDYWTFVHPDHRASRIAKRMIKQAKMEAQYRGLPLYLGIVSPVELETKMKFYARLGLRQIGAFYTTMEN